MRHALVPALALLLTPLAAMAQPAPHKTVGDVALEVGLNLARQEMGACRQAHPAHAERFAASLDQVTARLKYALDAMKPQRGEELSRVLPAAVQVGTDLTAALMAADPSLRTLEGCTRTAREIQQVSEREAGELMAQVVTTLLRASSAYQAGMERALGTPPPRP